MNVPQLWFAIPKKAARHVPVKSLLKVISLLYGTPPTMMSSFK